MLLQDIATEKQERGISLHNSAAEHSIARQRQRNSGRGGSLARRRYQTGSTILRGKKWIGRWREDIMDAEGNVRRVRRSEVIGTRDEFPTKKLARRRLELFLAKVNAPGYRPGRVATLAEFVDHWRTEVLVHRKPSTIHAAESHLRCCLLPTLGRFRLEQLGLENQQALVTRLAKTLRRKTLLNVLGTLGSILNTAKRWGYVTETINFELLALPPEEERRPARFFTAEEARKIIAAAGESFAAMFAVAALTGARPGELCGLKVEDLDFERRLICVRRSVWYGRIQAPKTNRSTRTLPMPEALAARLKFYLKTWRPNPLGLLFATRKGTPYTANNVVQRKLWPILDELKIPRCGLHAFRHTHSSLLVELGAPMTVAQAQLGHTDPRVTLGIYSHVVGDSQRRAVEKLSEVLDPIGPAPVSSSVLIH